MSLNTCVKNVSTPRSASFLKSVPARFKAAMSAMGVPYTRSNTSTSSAHKSQYTLGAYKSSELAKLRRSVAVLAASLSRFSSSNTVRS